MASIDHNIVHPATSILNQTLSLTTTLVRVSISGSQPKLCQNIATNEIQSRILFLGNPFSTDFCLFTKGLSALQFLYCTITISRAKLLHRNLPATSLHCLGDVSFALAQASLLLSPAASSPDTLLAPVLFAAFGPPFPTI